MFFMSMNVGAAAEGEGSLDSLLSAWHDDSRSFDDRILTFDELYRSYYQEVPDTLLHELEGLAIAAIEQNRPLILFEAWIRKGGLLNYQGRNDEALEAYQRADEVIRPLGDDMRLGTLAANRGNVYAQQSDFAEAMDSFTTALELYTAAEYEKGQRNVRMALGSVFVMIEMYALGKSQYEEVLAELEWQPENTRFRGLLYVNLGYCEFKLGHFERAGELYDQALPLLKQTGANFHLASCHQNLSILLRDQGMLEEAVYHANESFEMFERLGARENQLESRLNLAQIQLDSDVQDALVMAEGVLSELAFIESKNITCDLYMLLYRAHKELGHAELALEMHEQYLVFHDSIQEARNRYVVIRTAYEKDVEHRLNALRMEGQKEVDELRIRQLKMVLWIVGIFAFVVGLFIAFTLRSRSLNEKRKTSLLKEINALKAERMRSMSVGMPALEERRKHIESIIGRSLNETDWKVLNILLDDPTITNQGIAERAFLSVDGIGSSLRRMYDYFQIKETKYKKIALVHIIVKISMTKDEMNQHERTSF